MLVKMDGTKVAWTSRSAPKSAEVVYAQLEHARCGNNAWMRSFEDVWAAWQAAYLRGELRAVTEHMDKSTYSAPWPTIEMHMPNINLDLGKQPPSIPSHARQPPPSPTPIKRLWYGRRGLTPVCYPCLAQRLRSFSRSRGGWPSSWLTATTCPARTPASLSRWRWTRAPPEPPTSARRSRCGVGVPLPIAPTPPQMGRPSFLSLSRSTVAFEPPPSDPHLSAPRPLVLQGVVARVWRG